MNGKRLGSLLVACLLGAGAGPVDENPSLAFRAWIDNELFALTPRDVTFDFDPEFVISAIQTNADGSSREVNLRIVDWHGTGGYPLAESTAPATAFVRDRAPVGR